MYKVGNLLWDNEYNQIRIVFQVIDSDPNELYHNITFLRPEWQDSSFEYYIGELQQKTHLIGRFVFISNIFLEIFEDV